MATTIVPPAASDPSMTELRAMLGEPKTAAATTEAKPATSETPVEESTEENHETATEPVETKSNTETEEEPLPEGVQKRIEKEAQKAARAQAAIDRAVSERKAKEAEAAKLTSGEKGSDPVKTPQSSNERPKRPQLGETGHENETWAEFQAREDSYEEARDTFLRAETLREFQETQTRKAAQKEAATRWNAAVARHGKDFPALMNSARELAPEGLQVAISSLDNWDGVAVHLAKNPAQLKELAATYAQNSTKAIATLGRIEAALSSATKPAAAEKPLPEPLKKVGGTASASGQDFQTSVENGSMSQLRAMVSKIKKK